MRHPSEQELVLHYYNECAQPEWMRGHLRECAACREAFAELSQVLELTAQAPVPERDVAYGAAVWERLEPKLPKPVRRKLWFRWPAWALAGAAAAAAALVLLQPQPEAAVPTGNAAANRDAVLRMEVARHLEQSERFLMEVINGGQREQAEWAEDLLHSNRLLRQMAESRDVQGAGDVLEELELALTEAAHPNVGSPEMHFDGPEVLFRVRAVGARLRNQEVIYAKAY